MGPPVRPGHDYFRKDNEKDLPDVPEEYVRPLCIRSVENIDEVLAYALEDSCPTDAVVPDESKTPPLWTTQQPSRVFRQAKGFAK